MCNHNPIHCILPPYMLENMANSEVGAIRQLAVENMIAAAEVRMRRAMMADMPNFAAVASPSARKHRLIYNMKNGPQYLLPGTLVRSEGDPKHSDSAVNEAYNYSGTTYDFYNKILGRNSLDDHGMTLVSSVHLGRNYNNAFWDGSQMAYGDGDGVIFQRFTKSLDVVGHELTHGVISFTSNLQYRDESGALNEHFADVFGSVIKQWKKKQSVTKANWLIGDDIIVKTPNRRALRDIANPGTAYKNDSMLGDDPQPAHYSKRYKGTDDNGGVHINSGIPNRAFYLASMAIGGSSWTTAAKIWYKAMQQLGQNSDFAHCAQITAQVALVEFGDAAHKAVKDAWAAVGL